MEAKQRNPERIICFGDSITQGNECGAWPSILQEALNQRQPGRFEVINKGRSGDTSAQGFDRFESEILPHLPGILIIEFGINDSNHRGWTQAPRGVLQEFEKNIREFRRLATANGGRCVFIINHRLQPRIEKYINQGNGRSYQENLDPYNVIIRQVAEANGDLLIDLPRHMAENQVDLETFLYHDGVHLSQAGTRQYGRWVFDVIQAIL